MLLSALSIFNFFNIAAFITRTKLFRLLENWQYHLQKVVSLNNGHMIDMVVK